MRKIKWLFGVVAIALAAAHPLSAQPLVTTLKLTVSTETRTDQNHSAINKQVKVTQDLLNLLAQAYGTTFPAGSQLVLINYNTFQVWDSAGNVIKADVSQFLTFSFSDFLAADNYDAQSGAGKSSYVYVSTINYDDGTTNFQINGFTFEKYSESAQDSSGHRHFADSLKITGQGVGSISGQTVIVNGQVLLKGTSTE
jgi:hypothetical protein